MKTMFKALALTALFGMSAWTVRAADESAKTANFGMSALGVVYQSTIPGIATNGIPQSNRGGSSTMELRRLRTDNVGTQLVWPGLVYSTCVYARSSTYTFSVDLSSFGYCRNAGDNCNIWALASSSMPVFLKSIMWGSQNPIDGGNSGGVGDGAGAVRVLVYDTRGSTSTNMVGAWAGTTNTVVNVEQWFSSGVTIRKMDNGYVTYQFGQYNKLP